MSVPRWIDEQYSAHRPSFEVVDAYAASTLASFCERHKYQLTHRVKSPESISEKLESGRFQSWWDLDDFVAVTVIVPNLSHEGMVLRHLASVFNEARTEGRQRSDSDPRVFRFDCTRWYGTVRDDPPPEGMADEMLEIVFEVQIQTVLELAWSIATHDTTYKGADVDWAQQRLAASVKATIEQLDLMIVNFNKTAASIPKAPFPELDAKARVIQIFQELIEEKALDDALTPASWSRFADNLWRLVCHDTIVQGAECASSVVELATDLADSVRQGSFAPAVSGSLFQVVTAWTHQTHPHLLTEFPVAPSSELTEIYGFAPPVPISPDRPAAD